jgi:hypothetical protein
MPKRKPKSPIEGRWNIVSMTEWDEDYLHEEEQAFIEFSPKGSGEFHFGYVHGQMDCRATERDGNTAVEFRHTFLKHILGGVHYARIDIPRLFQSKKVCSVFGILKKI